MNIERAQISPTKHTSQVTEKLPQEYSAPRTWLDVLIENIDTIPQETKTIIDKKIHGINLTRPEQSQLDLCRNAFWRAHFGVEFEQKNNAKQTTAGVSQKQKFPHAEALKTYELNGAHKEFAENFEKHVVYEDDEILVINKPPGISTQGGAPQEPFSIASFIGTVRPGTAIVHRIDKETSGVLILGKTPHIRSVLVKNWKNVEKEKWYVAISSGNYDKSIIGSILPIKEKGAGAVVSKEPAKTSSTYFNKIMTFEKNGQPFSLLRVRIFSGRKHQIRVSLKHLGFPIVGDKLYNKKSRAARESARHLLHAYKLKLAHPQTGKIMEFTAPLPEDMRKFIGSYTNDHLD